MNNLDMLSKWRKNRNISHSDYKKYFTCVIEELLEPLYNKQIVGTLTDEIVGAYYNNDKILDEDEVIDAISDIRVFSINETECMGYNAELTLEETIAEISSRKQCPIQKKEWDNSGAVGKWSKWKEQPEDTLYKADYTKCKRS